MLWARKISLHRAPNSPSQSSKSPSQIRQASYLYEPMFSTLPGPLTIHWLRASFPSEWNARILLFHVWSASFSDTDYLNIHWCMYHSMLPMEGSSVWMAPALIFYDFEQSTPPAPQAQKEEEKQPRPQPRPQPLHQATVEDDTEHGNSMLDNKSTLSMNARLCTTPACRDPATCPSNFLASSLTSSFGSFFGSFLTSFSAFRFGYIECTEDIEASGQEWMLHCKRKALRMAGH